jgi:hypothetical protein
MLPYNSPDIWYDYVTLYWREPCKPNGIITGYIVSYNATTSTANLDCPVEENNMTFNVTGNVTFHKNCDSNTNVDIKAYSFHHILILTVL